MNSTSDALRDHVRHSVATREPIDETERRFIDEFLDLFDGLARPFDEKSGPVHVTGSAFVVGPRGVVLLLHRRLGIWVQPGGHVDPGESPWDAAAREAREETGLDVSLLGESPQLVHVDVHPSAKGHTHLDLRYLVGGDDTDPRPPPKESQDVAWFGWDEAIVLAGDESLRSALRALQPR